MLLKKIKIILFVNILIICTNSILVSKAKYDPIVVNLEINNYKDFPNYNNSNKYYIKEIIDKRGYSDKSNIGFTYKGAISVLTSFKFDKAIDEKFKDYFLNIFKEKNIISDKISDSQNLLKIDITSFQFTEIHDSFNAHLMINLEYNVIIFDINDKIVSRFNVNATDKISTWYTSEHANELATKVFISSVSAIINKLNNF